MTIYRMTGGKHSTGAPSGGGPAAGDKSKSSQGANRRNSGADKKQVTKMPHMVTRLPISDLNQHLTCALCSGYMVDASTVVECLHSFCRACLLRYLETSSTCPICDTQINTAQLDKCVRADHTLQDLVYKLVPGLYKDELRRRKDFYLEQCKSAADDGPSTSASKPEPVAGMQIFDKHLVELSAFICTPDEIVSFSLETTPKKAQIHSPGKSNVQTSAATGEGSSASDSKCGSSPRQKTKDTESKLEELNFKRYFRCPAAVTIGTLKKLLAHKMDLTSAHQVEILHSDEPLLDEYTLMDIAYIYTWRRKAPMQLFFNICKYELEEEPMPLLEPEIATPSSSTAATSQAQSAAVVIAPSTPLAQDVKPDFTAPSSLLPELPRVPGTFDAGGGKKAPNLDVKTDVTPSSAIISPHSVPPMNGASHASAPAESASIPARHLSSAKEPRSPAVKTVNPVVRPRRPSPTGTETSMRGKPPLPLDRTMDLLNNFHSPKPKPPPIVFNGKATPIRFTLSAPQCNGKKKAKSDSESIKPPAPKKPKPPPAPKEPSPPDVIAALQKITGFVTGASPLVPAPVQAPFVLAPIPETPALDAISIDTAIKGVVSPPSSAQSSVGSSDEASSPFPSPAMAYKPTAAQSACTQPAKLRLKKSLSHVVQELSSNALEACSPTKKLKFENGTGEELHSATLIH